jgi:hypothetical protein
MNEKYLQETDKLKKKLCFLKDGDPVFGRNGRTLICNTSNDTITWGYCFSALKENALSMWRHMQLQ